MSTYNVELSVENFLKNLLSDAPPATSSNSRRSQEQSSMVSEVTIQCWLILLLLYVINTR